jgi:hypothetical protein
MDPRSEGPASGGAVVGVGAPRDATIVVVLALAAGLLALLALMPLSGTAAIPPQCYSLVGYEVPCDAGPALLAGVITTGTVALVGWWVTRRR